MRELRVIDGPRFRVYNRAWLAWQSPSVLDQQPPPSPTMSSIRSSSILAFAAQSSANHSECCRWFNSGGRRLHRGSRFEPYPTEEEVLICSNMDADEESWHELGLSDFINASVRVGRLWYNRHLYAMLDSQCGLLNRGLELWDEDEEYSSILKVSLQYTASMGMMLYEQNECQCRRVCCGIILSEFVY